MMSRAHWLVLIADLRASREIPARSRRAVDKALLRAASLVARNHQASIRLGPQILKGDELQLVLKPEASPLFIATELRGRLRVLSKGMADVRIGLGSGAIERLSPRGPFSSDGAAFHLARAAIEHAETLGGARSVAWRTGREVTDEIVDSVLGLVDAVTARWTRPQWEAVLGRIEGRSLEGIARGHTVSFQSVSKRLIAASWREVESTLLTLQRLNSTNSTPGG
jgi:hypothetical protein